MKLLALTLLVAAPALAQTSADTLPARMNYLVMRAGNGHSPTADDINAAQVIVPPPDAAQVKQALPDVIKALANSDIPVRTYALTALAYMAAVPAPPADTSTTAPNDGTPPPPAPPSYLPPAYKSDVAEALTPAIPQIAAHLTDEYQPNRALTVTILGAFSPNPPAAVYPPLLAFLKREDAIGPIGTGVVADLLQLGPVSADTAATVARYLRRSDQSSDSRSNLVDAIASKPYQNPALNQAILAYLDGDDPNLKARVILSLPALDLTPDVFASAKSRITALADGGQDSLAVTNAAKAVAPCWTATKMTSGCPAY